MGLIDNDHLVNETEIGVLGRLVAFADRCGESILAAVREDDFIHAEYRQLWRIAEKLHAESTPISRITMQTAAPHELSEIIQALADFTPTSEGYREYIAALKKLSRSRKAHEIVTELDTQLMLNGDLDDIRTKAEQLLGVVSATEHAAEISLDEMQMQYLSTLGVERKYLDWGFDKFNRMLLCETDSADEGTLVYIGARPSVGKTALALQLGVHMAQKHNVYFYSCETGAKRAMQRIDAMMGLIDYTKVRKGTLDEADTKRLMRAKDAMLHRSFRFVPAAGWTASEITSHALNKRADIIIVDYLQLVRHSNWKLDQEEYARVSAVSRELQMFSRKHKKIVIALSQLSREGDETNPKMTNLRSSGQTEQDADIIAILHRPPHQGLTEEEEADYDWLRTFEIQKNRDGELGSIQMWFEGQFQRFRQGWEGFYQPIEPMPPERPRKQSPGQTKLQVVK